MKLFLFLLLLLPVCSAQFHIECYGRDPLGMLPQILHCSGQTLQACYIRDNGEKGCVTMDRCSQAGWTCCDGALCNV
ncbi:uncharacterized protein LOC144061416 [Vanacampus margaritifer]